MPITGPASFVSTTQEFLSHWQKVDAALPAAEPLTLEGGTTQAGFSTVRTTLITARDAVGTAALDRALARASLEMKKEWLLAHANMFKEKVLAAMSASVYARVLPMMPGIGQAREDFSTPMAQAAWLWEKIDAAPPAGFAGPLVLLDGTTQTLYATAVTALAGLYDALVGAEQEVEVTIVRRNDAQGEIYAMMKKYRLTVPTRIAEGEALLGTLPDLSPTSAATPAPVKVTAVWNAQTQQADFHFEPSTDAGIAEYEVRYTPGPEYDEKVEVVLGSIPPEGPYVYATQAGLPAPGATSSYKIFARLQTGGESGSNAVVMTRPPT